MEDASSGVNEPGKRLRLALLYAVLFLLLMGGVSIALWGIPDPKIMYVPVPILQWAFTGGMVAVLYRLTYHRKIDLGEADLYVWVIAKPVIGMVMGAMVYFLAVSGELFLNGRTEIQNIQFLNVLAFIGGFSDRLSIGLIDRIVAKSLDQQGGKTSTDQSRSGGI
jgi:peptidoglycan/LPS O-acetylase OafA/YrhL